MTSYGKKKCGKYKGEMKTYKLNSLFSLGGAHRTLQHDCLEAGFLQPPFDKLEHASKLAEHDAFDGMVPAAEPIKLLAECLDLGGAAPLINIDPVKDRPPLVNFGIDFNRGLRKVDNQWDMTRWAVRITTTVISINVFLNAKAAEEVVALLAPQDR